MIEQERPERRDEINPHLEGGRRKILEKEFPKDPWERFGMLLSALNISTKDGALLLLGRSLTPTTDLEEMFYSLYKGTEIANFSHKTAPGYCHQSLCPIGLVAQEITQDSWGKEKIIGYMITDAGEQYGQPVATAILDFEKRNGFSLYPILGGTAKAPGASIRAPFLRGKILLSLRGGVKRESDIATELKLSASTIGGALAELSQAEVISYNALSLATGKVQVVYVLGDTEVLTKPVWGDRALTKEVVIIAKQITEQRMSITEANVFPLLTEDIRKRRKERWLRKRIAITLSGLAIQGYLKRGEFKGGETESHAWLTPKGEVIEEFLRDLLDAVSDGPTLARLRQELLPKVKNKLSEYARVAGELYYPYSRSAMVKEHNYHRARIQEIIQSQPNLTVDDMGENLEREGLKLSKRFLRNVLLELTNRHRVARENRKGVYYYYPIQK